MCKFHDLLWTASELDIVLELVNDVSLWNTFNFFKKCVDLKTSMGTRQKVKKLHSTYWNCGDWTKQTDVDNCCYFNLKYYLTDLNFT